MFQCLSLFMLQLVSVLPASGQPVTGSVTVRLDTLHADQRGDLVVALYADGASWLDFGRAYRIIKKTVVPGLREVTFDSLPPGRYAVQVLHDRDRDGRLGFSWFPPGPTEGSGISNNNVRMGRPLFEPALFEVKYAAVRVDIIMRY